MVFLCLGIPGRVVRVDKEKRLALIDYSGERREVSTELVSVKPGDYVLVQARFVIQKIPRKEALEAIRVWEKSENK